MSRVDPQWFAAERIDLLAIGNWAYNFLVDPPMSSRPFANWTRQAKGSVAPTCSLANPNPATVRREDLGPKPRRRVVWVADSRHQPHLLRSEEHTSELQSRL